MIGHRTAISEILLSLDVLPTPISHRTINTGTRKKDKKLHNLLSLTIFKQFRNNVEEPIDNNNTPKVFQTNSIPFQVSSCGDLVVFWVINHRIPQLHNRLEQKIPNHILNKTDHSFFLNSIFKYFVCISSILPLWNAKYLLPKVSRWIANFGTNKIDKESLHLYHVLVICPIPHNTNNIPLQLRW